MDMQGDKPSTKERRTICGAAKRGRKTTMSKNAMNVMREHGAYPLDDTLNNDSLLSGVADGDYFALPPILYVDGNGNHLIWFQTKKNANGEQEWHDGQLAVESLSLDIDTTTARKLDYLGESPFDDENFNGKEAAELEDAKPVAGNSHFIIIGMTENGHTRINSILISDHGSKYHLVKNEDNGIRNIVLTHTMAAAVIYDLDDDKITDSDNHDLLVTVKGLMK